MLFKEERKLEEYLRYELEVYDEGFDQVYSDSSELPEDPLERAKLVISFNFSSLTDNEKARALKRAEHRIFIRYVIAFYNYLYDFMGN